jgi:hypothetical protein
MRFFRSTIDVLDAFRDQLIAMLDLPKNGTNEPWSKGVDHIAFAPHEYNDPRFLPMINDALNAGLAVEISQQEYESFMNASPLEND